MIHCFPELISMFCTAWNRLYNLANVNTFKLVYKYFEIDRMDIVITHLRSVLKQPESLNVSERRKLADLLLYCYLQQLALTSKSLDGTPELSAAAQLLREEFHQFLDTCPDFDVTNATTMLLKCGVIQDLFRLWGSARYDVKLNLATLSQLGFPNVDFPGVEGIMRVLESQRATNPIGWYEQQQDLLAHSSSFALLLPDEQVKFLTREYDFLARNLKRIYDLIPLLSEELLVSASFQTKENKPIKPKHSKFHSSEYPY
jgi:hypothetical protein